MPCGFANRQLYCISVRTTQVRATLPDLPYVSFVNPDSMTRATDDPQGFLASFTQRAMFDEVQRIHSPVCTHLFTTETLIRRGGSTRMSCWRNNTSMEIDIIQERAEKLLLIEVNSGAIQIPLSRPSASTTGEVVLCPPSSRSFSREKSDRCSS